MIQVLLLALFWAAAFWMPATRTLRFTVFLFVATSTLLMLGTQAGELVTVIRAALVVLLGAGILWPDYFHLGALSTSETVFDNALRKVERQVAGAAKRHGETRATISSAIEQLEHLQAPSPEWSDLRDRMIADLRREGAPSLHEAAAAPDALTPPTKEAWHRLRYRRVIGFRT